MKRLLSCLCAVLLACLATQTARAGEPASGQEPRQWWLATFSETGHEDIRAMLHTLPDYKKIRDLPADRRLKELVAVEPMRQGQPPLALVTYEGPFYCGSEGCYLQLLQRDARGIWRDLLGIITDPDFVAIGPGESHGYKDLVFRGGFRVDDSCPVWRLRGKRYRYLGLMEPGNEPCRSLNEKNEQMTNR